jgi:uncharacterized protein (DUF1684 family)
MEKPGFAIRVIRGTRVHFLQEERMSTLDQFRAQKDDFFQHDWQSPLTSDQREGFIGLKYYPENPALRLTLPIEPCADRETVTMITSTGSAREYVKYGQFSFEVNGEVATLQVYQDPENDLLFLPFVDATAPDDTYGAGRYLDIEPIGNGEFLIDFNYAYNPYCAYNDKWSCPNQPKENRVKVRIEAGEKNFK